jgi:UDP-N-acetylglucosamine 2-epimerase
MRILTVFGTRPEAIKLGPVARALSSLPQADLKICVTGQHRQMLDQALEIFELKPDFDLDLMKPDQDLEHVTTRTLHGVGSVINEFRPDWVIVQGDTTTAFAAALAAFYRKVKVAHVEAGLRTGNSSSPWPEEMNRKLICRIAQLHFAPTQGAAENLLREGIPASNIEVTGNTVIDALHWVTSRLANESDLRTGVERELSFLDRERRLILVTGHRRESFDGGLERVCQSLAALADRGDVQIAYPVHLNPRVQNTAKAVLAGRQGIHLMPPQTYVPFVYLMQRSHFIVTDSGGIQEEATALGKPVLVTRDTTERPEAVTAGNARLVGTSAKMLTLNATELLDDAHAYAAMATPKYPFGDGTAAARIAARLGQEPRAT